MSARRGLGPFPGVAPEHLGAALVRQAREHAGVSQVELARRSGVSRQSIGAYESGVRQPSLPALVEVLRVLGFEIALAVGGETATLSVSPSDATSARGAA